MARLRASNGENNVCGKNLAKLREAQCWSQRRLAKEMQLKGFDIDFHVVQGIESGVRFFTDIEIIAFSKVLEVEVLELFENIKY